MVAAAIRTIFAQPDADAVAEQLDEIADKLGAPVPGRRQQMLREAAPDILRLRALPGGPLAPDLEHQPARAAHQEVKRRADVVGIFPDEAATLRLVGAVPIEAHDEWAIVERRYLSEGSMAAILAGGKPSGMASDTPALLAS